MRAAELLVVRLALEAKPPRQPIVWVLPPSRSGGMDHAGVLGAELWKNFPESQLIRMKASENRGASNQKAKSLEERSALRFAPLELPNDVLSQARFVFVDDVVTSGATAMAAYMALGDPRRFEAWALAVRPKSERASLDS